MPNYTAQTFIVHIQRQVVDSSVITCKNYDYFRSSLMSFTGIVTRCPLVLKLKRVENGVAWSGRLTYKDQVKLLQKPVDVGQAVTVGVFFSSVCLFVNILNVCAI